MAVEAREMETVTARVVLPRDLWAEIKAEAFRRRVNSEVVVQEAFATYLDVRDRQNARKGRN